MPPVIITFLGTDAGNEGDLSVAANYDPVGVPVATDHVHFDSRSSDVSAGWATFNAIALGSVHFHADWTNQCDTDVNDYIQFTATTIWVGEDYGATPGTGSPRIKIDVDAESTIHVLRTSQASTDGFKPPVRVIMDHNAATLHVRDGSVGVSIDEADEAGELGDIFISEGANVTVGAGVTLANVFQTGGVATVYCAMSGQATIKGGTFTTEGTGAVVTITQSAGTVVSNSTGAVTVYNLSGGDCDTLESNVARTITTMNQSGGTLKRDNAVVTIGTHNVTGRVSAQVAAA